MSWRIVYIQSASKLSLNLDNLQVKYHNEKFDINLDEIQTLVLEDNRCIITARLLSKLSEEGINVVFCENNKMPVGSLNSLNNNSRTSKVNKIQMKMNDKLKKYIWQEIVKIKINSQADVLQSEKKDNKYLKEYANNVLIGDVDNKEGQAARVYFKILFGKNFVRFDEEIINYCLNYTYQIIRSKISQEIVGRGLNPSIGIFHKNEYNYFNLADDLIEVYRPIIDKFVIEKLDRHNLKYLTPELKEKLLEIYVYKVKIGAKQMKLVDSINIFINCICDIYLGKSKTITKYPQLIIE